MADNRRHLGMAMRAPRTLSRLVYYAAVVESGSFTAAARQLGVTKAVVSEQVARLEQEAGATLLSRTTRRVVPTDAGRAFHAHCAAILRQCEDAFEELEQTASSPQGLLRIAAPNDYGAAVVAPAVAAFARRYPDCSVALSIGDRTLDLVAEQIDLAVRVGWLQDSSLQTRTIGTFRELLVCGAGFAAAIAGLQDPGALEALPWVAHATHRDTLQRSFLGADDARRDIRIRSAIMIDAAPAVHQAVAAGAGLAVLPDFLVAADIASGRLVHVLPGWRLRTGGIHAVFPPARYRPAKVRAFVEVLLEVEKRRQAVAGPAPA
ncbi:LysR family transcriptional regulator [Plastoroseomonas hellenica]|nr:LysR family transcriptional regulator [Plastoroseomonas hellenica]